MKQENFERAVHALIGRQPFRPFTIELVNASRIEVNHPEALTFQGELLVCKSTSGAWSVFEWTGVVRLVTETGIG